MSWLYDRSRRVTHVDPTQWTYWHPLTQRWERLDGKVEDAQVGYLRSLATRFRMQIPIRRDGITVCYARPGERVP